MLTFKAYSTEAMRAMDRFYSVFIGFSTRALFIIQDPVQDPVQHAVAMASSLLQSVALFQCHRPAHPAPPAFYDLNTFEDCWSFAL